VSTVDVQMEIFINSLCLITQLLHMQTCKDIAEMEMYFESVLDGIDLQIHSS
jgi:hypothetical protein